MADGKGVLVPMSSAIIAMPGAGPFDCEAASVGQSCRAKCDSGSDAVMICEENGWTLQDECPESDSLDAGVQTSIIF